MWAELRLADGSVVERLSASEALALACGDATAPAGPGRVDPASADRLPGGRAAGPRPGAGLQRPPVYGAHMRPIPAPRLGDAHGLLRAIAQRERIRLDEFVTEFEVDELFPPGLENALGRTRQFVSYARAAGLVNEDRGTLELTEMGKRYVRAGDEEKPFDVAPAQAEWLRRLLRERHMTDSIYHGAAVGLSLCARRRPTSARDARLRPRARAPRPRRAGTTTTRSSRRAALHALPARHGADRRRARGSPTTGQPTRGELTLAIHMSLHDLAGQLNPGGPRPPYARARRSGPRPQRARARAGSRAAATEPAPEPSRSPRPARRTSTRTSARAPVRRGRRPPPRRAPAGRARRARSAAAPAARRRPGAAAPPVPPAGCSRPPAPGRRPRRPSRPRRPAAAGPADRGHARRAPGPPPLDPPPPRRAPSAPPPARAAAGAAAAATVASRPRRRRGPRRRRVHRHRERHPRGRRGGGAEPARTAPTPRSPPRSPAAATSCSPARPAPARRRSRSRSRRPPSRPARRRARRSSPPATAGRRGDTLGRSRATTSGSAGIVIDAAGREPLARDRRARPRDLDRALGDLSSFLAGVPVALPDGGADGARRLADRRDAAGPLDGSPALVRRFAHVKVPRPHDAS